MLPKSRLGLALLAVVIMCVIMVLATVAAIPLAWLISGPAR